jgi:hypothetical protein
MAGVRIDRRPGKADVSCMLRRSDPGPRLGQHHGGPACTGIGRRRTSGFRRRRRLGWLNLCRDRFARNSPGVLCGSVLYRGALCRIPDIEFIGLGERIPHEAVAGRGWTCDGFLGNRCGHPRRERSAKTCKAKRRDPNCPDQNETPVSNVVGREETPSSRPSRNWGNQP